MIFVVEDDPELAGMIAGYLREHGFVAETEARGDRAVGRILAARPAAVVLDVMLPGKDGLTVCRELRSAYRGPILMLTALGAEVDEVAGLELATRRPPGTANARSIGWSATSGSWTGSSRSCSRTSG